MIATRVSWRLEDTTNSFDIQTSRGRRKRGSGMWVALRVMRLSRTGRKRYSYLQITLAAGGGCNLETSQESQTTKNDGPRHFVSRLRPGTLSRTARRPAP